MLVPFASASLLSLAAAAFAAVAAELPDPTRPPAAMHAASPGGPAPAAAAAPALVLQSVLVGEGRRPSAIINGRVVELGDALDGLRLVRVFDGGAILSGPTGATTLALTPGSEKVAVDGAAQPLLAMKAANRRVDAAAPMARGGERK
jgi:MSHA biogenesis protein MshK